MEIQRLAKQLSQCVQAISLQLSAKVKKLTAES
jgi:hypothetical protein